MLLYRKGDDSMTPIMWLQILFIGLKLTDYITWSWWQVMIPTMIYFVAIIIHVANKE